MVSIVIQLHMMTGTMTIVGPTWIIPRIKTANVNQARLRNAGGHQANAGQQRLQH